MFVKMASGYLIEGKTNLSAVAAVQTGWTSGPWNALHTLKQHRHIVTNGCYHFYLLAFGFILAPEIIINLICWHGEVHIIKPPKTLTKTCLKSSLITDSIIHDLEEMVSKFKVFYKNFAVISSVSVNHNFCCQQMVIRVLYSKA